MKRFLLFLTFRRITLFECSFFLCGTIRKFEPFNFVSNLFKSFACAWKTMSFQWYWFMSGESCLSSLDIQWNRYRILKAIILIIFCVFFFFFVCESSRRIYVWSTTVVVYLTGYSWKIKLLSLWIVADLLDTYAIVNQKVIWWFFLYHYQSYVCCYHS